MELYVAFCFVYQVDLVTAEVHTLSLLYFWLFFLLIRDSYLCLRLENWSDWCRYLNTTQGHLANSIELLLLI